MALANASRNKWLDSEILEISSSLDNSTFVDKANIEVDRSYVWLVLPVGLDKRIVVTPGTAISLSTSACLLG